MTRQFSQTAQSLVNVDIERTPEAVAVMDVYARPEAEQNTPSGQSNPDVNSCGTSQTNLVSKPLSAPGTEYCGKLAVLAEDEPGVHAFRKTILCMKEYCPKCGQDDSDSHKRRRAGWIDNVQRVKSLGYFVIQLPLSKRHELLNGTPDDIRARLRAIKAIVVKAFRGKRQRDGSYSGRYSRLLGRWHWFGDVCVQSKDNICQVSGNTCPKKRCENFENDGRFNPHLNILVDDGFIDNETFEAIKSKLREALKTSQLIVNYRYTDEPAKMVHIVSYVTRSTFKEYLWSPKLANSLWHFANGFSYGNWNTTKVWEIPDKDDKAQTGNIVALQSGVCPVCGRPLAICRTTASGQPCYWSRPIDINLLAAYPATELGGGFALLQIPQNPLDVAQIPGQVWLQFDDRLKLEAMRHRHIAAVRAKCRADLNEAMLTADEIHNREVMNAHRLYHESQMPEAKKTRRKLPNIPDWEARIMLDSPDWLNILEERLADEAEFGT